MASTEREILELRLRAELGGTDVAALLDLGETCQRVGLEEDANKAFHRVLELDPSNPFARQGRLRYLRRRYAAAASDSYERAALIHQVGELRDSAATGWLAGLLDAAEPVVCQKVAEALGRSGDRSAVPVLIRLLRSDAACAWWQASEALAAIGDRAAVPPLVATLGKGSANARAAAAHALGMLRDPAALDGLTEAVGAGDAAVRCAAAKALGQLGDAAAAPALAQVLSDPDPETRAAAVASFGELVGRPFRPSLFRSAERAARRWWAREGRLRTWGRRGAPQATLDALRRRRTRAERHALLIGGLFLALALAAVAGLLVFLSLALRR